MSPSIVLQKNLLTNEIVEGCVYDESSRPVFAVEKDGMSLFVKGVRVLQGVGVDVKKCDMLKGLVILSETQALLDKEYPEIVKLGMSKNPGVLSERMKAMIERVCVE